MIEYIDSETGLTTVIEHENFNEEIPCVGDHVKIMIHNRYNDYKVVKRKWVYNYKNSKQNLHLVEIYLKRT